MGIRDFMNDYKYPILALALLLLVYGVLLQANQKNEPSKITGFATVGPAGSLSSSTYSCSRTSVSWSKPTTYPSGVTIYYIVWYSVYSNFPSSGTLSTSPSTSRSKTLSGLAPGVKYYWRVYSYPSNNFWAGSYSSYRSFTQSCKPTGLLATVVDCSSEQLTWTAPTGGGVSGYLVALSTSSTFSNSLLYFPSPVTATTYTFRGLNGATQYYARVAGYYTINGNNYYDTSNYVGFTTNPCTVGPPNPPTELRATPCPNPSSTNPASNCMTFSWTKSNAANYKIELAYSQGELESGFGPRVLGAPTTGQNSYTWYGLPCMWYFWRIWAYTGDITNGVYTTTQQATLDTATQSCNSSGVNPTPGVKDGDEYILFYVINIARSNNQLGPLAYDSRINEVAELRAQHIMTKGWGHVEPDGSTVFTYLTQKGIPYGWAGENLARNNYPSPAIKAYNDFLASEGHRLNVLNVNYKKMAVGESVGLWNAEGSVIPYNFAVVFTD